jgi:hypothetical protein
LLHPCAISRHTVKTCCKGFGSRTMELLRGLNASRYSPRVWKLLCCFVRACCSVLTKHLRMSAPSTGHVLKSLAPRLTSFPREASDCVRLLRHVVPQLTLAVERCGELYVLQSLHVHSSSLPFSPCLLCCELELVDIRFLAHCLLNSGTVPVHRKQAR